MIYKSLPSARNLKLEVAITRLVSWAQSGYNPNNHLALFKQNCLHFREFISSVPNLEEQFVLPIEEKEAKNLNIVEVIDVH